jgi:uncharacterized protein
MAGCFRPHDDGIDLFVRLTPRTAADEITGIETTADGRVHLSVRVRAVPEKGRANAALEALLAERFRLPKSCVSVVSGSTARLKTVRLVGDPAAISQRLELLV